MNRPSLLDSGLRGACPRCGARTLFDGVVAFADACPACGLDFAGFEVGDGPAGFLTLIVGAAVIAGAVSIQLAYDPPLALQLAIWLPVTAILVTLALRVAKGVLLALEYRNDAGGTRAP